MQALHWLDAVRYGDSAGFHGDNLWPVWPYRDYVLRAFRDNMPFDQFTREQLAGDLLPDATTDQKIASAFNRLNRASAEGGIQPKEYIAKYGADRVRTVSTVWLGSTLGLRRVPRPQIRSVHLEGLLFDEGLLRRYPRNRVLSKIAVPKRGAPSSCSPATNRSSGCPRTKPPSNRLAMSCQPRQPE